MDSLTKRVNLRLYFSNLSCENSFLLVSFTALFIEHVCILLLLVHVPTILMFPTKPPGWGLGKRGQRVPSVNHLVCNACPCEVSAPVCVSDPWN